MTNEQKLNEFRYIVLPLMRWLEENHHPHITCIVTSRNAELLEGQYNVVLNIEE